MQAYVLADLRNGWKHGPAGLAFSPGMRFKSTETRRRLRLAVAEIVPISG